MSISVLVEVAIGVLFVWILLAAITSQVQDWVSQWLQWRPTMLQETINNILADDELTDTFYKHPLIKSLHSKKGTRKPSQIPSRQFASVVFDMLINAGSDKSPAASMENAIQRLRDNTMKLSRDKDDDLNNLAKTLDTLLVDVSMNVEKADQSIAEARNRIELWFNDSMDRLSGSYKRKMQGWALIIGIILAVALNADSLAIANTLWKEPLVREALVAQADQLKLEDLGIQGNDQSTTPSTSSGDLAAQNLATLESLSIPIGWSPDNIPNDFNGWAMKLGGILLSGVAAAQGAPFWFDIVRKLLNFRSGGGGGSSAPAQKEEAKG